MTDTKKAEAIEDADLDGAQGGTITVQICHQVDGDALRKPGGALHGADKQRDLFRAPAQLEGADKQRG